MSSLLMSINFGDGTSASFQARAQVTLKVAFGLTHTFPLPGFLTACSPFFEVGFGGGGLRRFMIGSPVGRRPSPGLRGGEMNRCSSLPAPNTDDFTTCNAAGYDVGHTL